MILWMFSLAFCSMTLNKPLKVHFSAPHLMRLQRVMYSEEGEPC